MMTYPFVMDFIKIYQCKRYKNFYACIYGWSSSIGIDGKMKTILVKKRFSSVSLKVFRMPNNIFYVWDDKYNNFVKIKD
jgi:hypothetical protein